MGAGQFAQAPEAIVLPSSACSALGGGGGHCKPPGQIREQEKGPASLSPSLAPGLSEVKSGKETPKSSGRGGKLGPGQFSPQTEEWKEGSLEERRERGRGLSLQVQGSRICW